VLRLPPITVFIETGALRSPAWKPAETIGAGERSWIIFRMWAVRHFTSASPERAASTSFSTAGRPIAIRSFVALSRASQASSPSFSISSSIFLPAVGSSAFFSFRSTVSAKPAAARSFESISRSKFSSKPGVVGNFRNTILAGAAAVRLFATSRISSAPSCTEAVRSGSTWNRSASASGREKSSQKS